MQYLLLWNVMLIIFLSGCGPSPQSIVEAYNNGQKDIVWDYIDNGGSVNIADQRPNGTNCTLLMLAMNNKDTKLADRILSDPKFDISFEKKRTFNVLHMAAALNDIAILEKILPMFDNVNIGEYSDSPLFYAVAGNSKDAVIMLLARPEIELNYYNGPEDRPYFRPVLHLAILKGYVDIVKTLLEYGADPGIKNNNGEDALEVALKQLEKVRMRMDSTDGEEKESIVKYKNDLVEIINVLHK